MKTLAARHCLPILLISLIFSSCKKERNNQDIPILSTRPLKVKPQDTSRPQTMKVKLTLTPNVQLEVARRELYRGNYEKAAELYGKVLTIKGITTDQRVTAMSGLAEAYFSLNQFERALVTWQKVAALRPENAFAHHNMALAYYRLGKMDKAIAELQKALELDPDELAARIDYISIMQEATQAGKTKFTKDDLVRQVRLYMSSREKLIGYLREGKDATKIIKAIEVLDQVPDPVPSDAVLPLLEHPSSQVRISAGYMAARYPRGKSELKRRLHAEKDPRVKEAWEQAIKYAPPLESSMKTTASPQTSSGNAPVQPAPSSSSPKTGK